MGVNDLPLAIRAEHVAFGGDCNNTYRGIIEQVPFEGDRTQFHANIPDLETTVRVINQDVDSQVVHSRGDEVTIGWDAADVFVYPDET